MLAVSLDVVNVPVLPALLELWRQPGVWPFVLGFTLGAIGATLLFHTVQRQRYLALANRLEAHYEKRMSAVERMHAKATEVLLEAEVVGIKGDEQRKRATELLNAAARVFDSAIPATKDVH